MIRLAAAISVLFAAMAGPAVAQTPSVTVLAPAGHPGAAGCLAGLRQALPNFGYTEGENVGLSLAEADSSDELQALIEEAVGGDPAVIVPVSTAVATAVAQAAGETPIVFCGVPDPVSAGLATDLIRPGGTATGVTDMPPISEQLALINEMVPGGSRLGFIYNPDHGVSVRIRDTLEKFAPGAGFTLTMAEVTDSDGVEAAMEGILDEVDAIYIPPDRTVLAAFDSALAAAENASVPLFTGDADWVERGAVGSLGFDYTALGQQVAALVARVLDGESPSDIPISPAESTYLVVNAAAAERMGLELSPGFLARANAIVE